MNSRNHYNERANLSRNQFFFAYWFPLIVYCCLIFYISSLVFIPGPPGLLGDEIKHTIEYSVLGILVFRLVNNTRYRRFSYITAILFCFMYGVSDELHQSIIPTRIFSTMDIFFDSFGGTLIVIGDWLKGKVKVKPIQNYNHCKKQLKAPQQ